MKMTFKNLFKVLGLDKVDWKKATTRLLAVLWGVLIFSWICKLFLGKQFNIMTNNEYFINVCHYLEKTGLFYLVYYPLYLLSTYQVVLIISRDYPKKKHYIYLIILTIMYILKIFNESIASILEILFYLITSLIYSKKIWRGVEVIFITVLFQLISLITKNIGYKLTDENTIITLIYLIDYYIMMSIYCINTIIRKEGIIMGLVGPFLLSKKARQLTAYREKLMSKRVKLDSRIREVDRAIENEKHK